MDTVNPEVATEVHYMVLLYLERDKNHNAEDYKNSFDNWLSDEGDIHTYVVGKALAFREALNFSLSSRFEEAGWDEAKGYHQGIIDKYKNSSDPREANMAPRSETILADIPRRIRIWTEFGKSWRDFSGAELTNEALKTYQEGEMFKDMDKVLNPEPVTINLTGRS
ncbi:hypothetical protein [Methylobacterium sp. B1]|uniref:hypothetical protein n=1 Tax=Methylobacterium sp. B1 TaxID=91459 RepID=UPI0011D1A5D8|nr:hypothetical protein [Methylobacterium sp. B1]